MEQNDLKLTRKPEYLSPTALARWKKSPEEYFMYYLALDRPPRFPQTKPMAVGSAFDAYIKSYLHKEFFGVPGDYELDKLLTTQVEKQNRDFARKAGLDCFNQYRGHAEKLLLMLGKSFAEPRFEVSLKSEVKITMSEIMVPLFGKPDLLFDVSENYSKELIATKKEGSGYKIVDGIVKGRTQAVWFTNLNISKRHEKMILYKEYNAEEYPTYDNYDAINVNKTVDIPMDYDGVMGVPITFLNKYNPDQFEIIDGLNRYTILNVAGLNENAVAKHLHMTEINGKSKYFRILIQKG